MSPVRSAKTGKQTRHNKAETNSRRENTDRIKRSFVSPWKSANVSLHGAQTHSAAFGPHATEKEKPTFFRAQHCRAPPLGWKLRVAIAKPYLREQRVIPEVMQSTGVRQNLI